MADPNRKAAEEEFSPSQIALMIAAERLFGDRSIESVSLREIAIAAGNGNNNAVQYHFGTKEGLLDALFRYRVKQMEGPRSAMLEAMERDGALGDLRRLAEVYCLPLLDLTDENGRHTYANFMSQYILRYRPQGVRHAVDSVGEGVVTLRRLQALVADSLAHLPADLIEMRLGLVYLIFANMLVRSDNDGTAQNDPTLFRGRIEDILSMMEAAYSVGR